MIGVALRFFVGMLALLIDRLVGEPAALYRRVPHPVVVMGFMINMADRLFNLDRDRNDIRRTKGTLCTLLLAVIWGVIGVLLIKLAALLGPAACLIHIIVLSMLLSGKSLYDHGFAIYRALTKGNYDLARRNLSKIVGRDTAQMSRSDIVRASVESLSENLSDGVIAPLFFYLLAGLPGVLVYKFINTADSMIGHKTARHNDFGWCAARLDDVLNYIPARLTAGFIALGAQFLLGRGGRTIKSAWRDGGKHASVNAGNPEAAMAGALDLALGGLRSYNGVQSEEPWLNAGARLDGSDEDFLMALRLLNVVIIIAMMLCGFVFIWKSLVV